MRDSTTMRGRVGLAIAALGLSAWGVTAQAQIVVGQDQFQVTANVLGQCNVIATNLNFGSYAQGSATNVDAQSQVSVVCPDGTAFAVGLDGGLSPGAGLFANRAMTGGNPPGTQLEYDLFTNAGRTTLWGNNFGVDTQVGIGAAPAAVNFTVFGRVPLGQSPNPGAYQDTVSAFVYF